MDGALVTEVLAAIGIVVGVLGKLITEGRNNRAAFERIEAKQEADSNANEKQHQDASAARAMSEERLGEAIERVSTSLDGVAESLHDVRERTARIEGGQEAIRSAAAALPQWPSPPPT